MFGSISGLQIYNYNQTDIWIKIFIVLVWTRFYSSSSISPLQSHPITGLKSYPCQNRNLKRNPLEILEGQKETTNKEGTALLRMNQNHWCNGLSPGEIEMWIRPLPDNVFQQGISRNRRRQTEFTHSHVSHVRSSDVLTLTRSISWLDECSMGVFRQALLRSQSGALDIVFFRFFLSCFPLKFLKYVC